MHWRALHSFMHRKRLCCTLSCNKFQHRRKIAPSGKFSRRRLTFCRAAGAALYLFSHEACRGEQLCAAVRGAGALRMRHTPCGCCPPLAVKRKCQRGICVGTNFTSLTPPQAAGLVRFVVPPFPTRIASLDSRGSPFFGIPLKRPRRGLMPPSWIIPGVWFVQSTFQISKKRDADADLDRPAR